MRTPDALYVFAEKASMAIQMWPHAPTSAQLQECWIPFPPKRRDSDLPLSPNGAQGRSLFVITGDDPLIQKTTA